MKRIILLIAVCFISVSLAQEFPVTSSPSGFFQYDPGVFDREENVFTPSNLPVWSVLENMSLEEKQNALIDIEYNGDLQIETFKQITNLWNAGKYNQALDLFRSINDDELKGVSIGISWKVPIPTADKPKWGTDVRIGNRDSIEAVSLAFQKSTGNLFAVLLYQEEGRYYWSVNLSTNGGSTWTETYDWFSVAKIVSANVTVVGQHCYVGYASAVNKNEGRLRRFSTADGAVANFPNGSAFTTVFTLASTDSVKEVVVASNQSFQNNRLYYAAITKTDSVKYFWNNPDGVVYNKLTSTFTDAEEGLDITWNDGFDFSQQYGLFGSYITKTGSIKIFGAPTFSDTLKQTTNLFTGLANNFSSVSARNDTITAVFEYYAGVNKHNRYLVSYNGGTTWFFGVVGDSTTTSETPDIAAGDGGVGIIYRYYTSPREGRFVWRPMAGTWSTPVKYTDHQPYFNKPAIEYLGNKKFGVVYLSWTSPVTRGAYFDMNDMTVGIGDDLASSPSGFNLLQNYPNPFNPTTLISYQIPTQSNVSIKVYDALGNLVKVLVNEEKPVGTHQVEFNAEKLASGIYFYRIQAGSFTQTKKMLLVR